MGQGGSRPDVSVVHGQMVIWDRETGLVHIVRGWYQLPMDMGHGNIGEADTPHAWCGIALSIAGLFETGVMHATCLRCLRRWIC